MTMRRGSRFCAPRANSRLALSTSFTRTGPDPGGSRCRRASGLLHRGQVRRRLALRPRRAAALPPMRLVPRKTPPVSMRTLRASTSPSMRPLATMSRWPVATMFPCTCPATTTSRPLHVAAHDAAFADDDRRLGLDRALDGAVDAEGAVGLRGRPGRGPISRARSRPGRSRPTRSFLVSRPKPYRDPPWRGPGHLAPSPTRP